jgi:glucose-1-phosphate adenylyltransferase
VFNVVQDAHARLRVIFGGDHIYKMDVRQMLDRHFETEAELTVAAIPVPYEEAKSFGVLQVDAEGRVLDFVEKSEHPPEIPGRPGGASPPWATTSSM